MFGSNYWCWSSFRSGNNLGAGGRLPTMISTSLLLESTLTITMASHIRKIEQCA
jgi:hypothetical protein